MSQSLEEFKQRCEQAGVHTVEVGTPDSQGHLRGKRVPVNRFFEGGIHRDGCAIADAIFVFDIQNDLPDNEFVNMETGFLDCHLHPDIESGRILTHRPGYAIVLASVTDPDGAPHPLAPRTVLATQIAKCKERGLDPVVATELEFYLFTPEWDQAQSHIQYSSLTDALDLEEALAAMRAALLGAGLDVESSNAEYGPGQIEVNISYSEALRCADDTVLFKSIVKQVAVQHGLRASFMPKPWGDQSGSGMHVHTSLRGDGGNAFASSDGAPNELMSHWLGGILAHAQAITFLGSPTVNGARRIRPYTFAPTHVHWGGDNRTVLARCITEPGSQANRVEHRSAGADANAYLMIAGILAAGADGLARELDPGPMSEGDMYASPGDHPPLPTTLQDAIDLYAGSALAAEMGEMFSKSYVSISEAEVALGAEHSSADPEEVNDWERQRYLEFS